MLKKISNWTFGSIFRTIGRFLAYILIGIVIALLFTKKDYVKALTLDGTYRGGYNIFNGLSWEKEFTNCVNCPTPSNSLTNTWNFQNNWTQQYDNYYMVFTLAAYSQRIEQSRVSNDWFTDVELEKTILAIELGTTNDTWVLCELQNNFIVCPLIKGREYNKLRITANMPTSNTSGYLSYNSWTISLFSLINLYEKDNASSAIQNQTQQQQQQHNETMNYFNNTISGEVNGTGENGTITDADAESNSCGIICKLKHLIKMLSIDNIKYLVVPTEEQMNDLFNQMQEKITSKLGILGLPVTVYTRLMQIAMQYEEGNQNWCLTWNAVQVPNFEDFNIIQAGSFCFSDILQNEKINTFRNTCQMIIGGLILLSFIQYLFNCLHRILDVPVQDNYEYFTTEDVYGIDTDTGEVQSHTIKSRTTTRRPL